MAVFARVLSLVLLVAACTGSDSTAEDSDGGRLVVLDTNGNIVVMAPDGSNQLTITDDGGESALYTQPVWSPDGSSLAWGQVSEDGFALGIQAIGESEVRTVEMSNLPFYMSWSPNGSSIGALHNGPNGIDFVMVDVAEASTRLVDTGVPYYFSWSPSGDELVVHVGEDRFERIDPDGENVFRGTTDRSYLAPQWTERGIFHVDEGSLLLEGSEGERTAVTGVTGLALFVASPDGSKVALQTTGDDSALEVALGNVQLVSPNVVVLVDVETADIEVVGEQPAVGFFWSPDGHSLLIIEATPNRDAVVAKVWNDGEVTEYAHYRPSAVTARDMFPFFPQYAQSVSFWSPDGSAFAFAGTLSDEEGIWVQELGESEPTRVSSGVWVAWSS